MKKNILLLILILFLQSLGILAKVPPLKIPNVEKEIFGKIILKLDSKKFSYHRPGSFGQGFPVKPDQGLILFKGDKSEYLVLTQIDEWDDKDFGKFCAESVDLTKKIQIKGQKTKLVKVDLKNCQVLSESTKNTTIQWLHLYEMRGKKYVLSLNTTRPKSKIGKTVKAIKDLLRDNFYELN